jgi:hypothetical protein
MSNLCRGKPFYSPIHPIKKNADKGVPDAYYYMQYTGNVISIGMTSNIGDFVHPQMFSSFSVKPFVTTLCQRSVIFSIVHSGPAQCPSSLHYCFENIHQVHQQVAMLGLPKMGIKGKSPTLNARYSNIMELLLVLSAWGLSVAGVTAGLFPPAAR